MKKSIFGIVLLLLAVLWLSACNPITTVPLDSSGKADGVCEHPSLKEITVPSTCTELGYAEQTCEECGYSHKEELPIGHVYKELYDTETGRSISECEACGIRGYLLEAGHSLELNGYFEGDAFFAVGSVFGEGEVDFWVDSNVIKTVSCGVEKVTLSALNMRNEMHTFTFVNKGENDVLVAKGNLDGKLSRKDALLVEILPAKAQYNSLYVYVQTSDPSGDYYIRYSLQYRYDDRRDVYSVNSATNVDCYRLVTADVVKIEEIKGGTVSSTLITQGLSGGELSLSASQVNVDRSVLTNGAIAALGKQTQAVDSVGGYNGDERIETVALFADGEEIEIFGRTKGEVIACTYVAFDQTTTVYAWGTSTASSYGEEMMLHTQRFVFDTNGVHNQKEIMWLDDDYTLGAFFFHMFSMRREFEGKPVCEIVESYGHYGGMIQEIVTSVPSRYNNWTYDLNQTTRRVCYRSETSGVSAETAFEIVDSSVVIDGLYIYERGPQQDNKLYVSFASPISGKQPLMGDIWAVNAFYHMDYIEP